MKRKIDTISSTVRVVHDEREDRLEHLHGGRWTVVHSQYRRTAGNLLGLFLRRH